MYELTVLEYDRRELFWHTDSCFTLQYLVFVEQILNGM